MVRNQDPRPPTSFSNNPRPTPPSPPPVKKRALLWQCVRRGVAGGFAVGVAAYFVANLTASWLLHRELAEVVGRGEPLQLSALVPPAVAPSENAALVYLRAADALLLTEAEKERLRTTNGSRPDPELLTKNRVALQLTRRAAEITRCRFPVDYGAKNLAGILLPHLSKMRWLAELVRDQARWEAQQGQMDAALADIAVLFRMSEHLTPEPILISGLTAMSIEKMGYTALADILDTPLLSAAQLREFAARLGHTDWTAAMRHDTQGERCFGLWAFQYVSNPIEASQILNTAGTPTFRPGMKLLSMLWSPLWKLDEIQYLRAIDRRSEALQRPGDSLSSDDSFNRDLPWYAICTRVMLPALPRIGQKRDQLLTYRRMAVTALALHTYRASEGTFPPDLHAAERLWGAALPRDLYNGQPFHYTTDGRTMRLYSVGSNGADEGGRKATRSGDSDNSAGEGDLLWQEDKPQSFPEGSVR
jgi:hypothetical protein